MAVNANPLRETPMPTRNSFLCENSTDRLDRAWNVVLKDYPLFLWALASAVIVYGTELFHFSFSIDEEFAQLGGVASMSRHVLRWGMDSLGGLGFPERALPFFSPLYSLFFLSLAACLFVRVLELRGQEAVAFCVLFAAFPQFAYQMQFAFQAPYVAFGYVLLALAFHCYILVINNSSKIYSIPCILCLALATGIYQALIFVFPVLFLIRKLMQMTDSAAPLPTLKNVLAEAVVCILLMAVGIILYALISKMIFGTATSDFLAGNFGWLTRNFFSAATNVISSTWSNLSGANYFGEAVFTFALIPLLAFFPALWRRYTGLDRIWAFGLLFCAFVSPFLQIICFGSGQAPRTFLAQGILFAFICAFSLRLVRVHKLIAALLLAACVLTSGAYVSRMFFQDMLTTRRDAILATQIVSRIQDERNFDPAVDNIYFHGTPSLYPFPDMPWADVFGSSFFTHDGGSMYRMVAYFRALGIAELYLPRKEEIMMRLPAIEQMPKWPHPDSLRRIDGLWVLKLGDSSGFIEDLGVHQR